MPASRCQLIHVKTKINSIAYRQQGLIERGNVPGRHVPDDAGAIGNPNSMGMAACEEQGQ